MTDDKKFLDVKAESTKNYVGSSSLRFVKQSQTYLVKCIISGIKGKPFGAYFGLILFDESRNPLGRRIKWLNDFSGKEKNYLIIFKTPNNCKYIKFIYRINDETPIKSDCNYILTIPGKIEFIETDGDEDFELAWQYDIPRIKLPDESEKRKNFEINYFEKKVYSQNGEDGILEFIFEEIGTTNKYFVEFGVENGLVCNTKFLKKKYGWSGLWMDCKEDIPEIIKKEFVTAENINDLLIKYNVPKNFDLLSIDVDFNDFWIWKAIENHSPRVVIIEYNSSISPEKSLVVSYSPFAEWDRTNYFGASLLALKKLGIQKDYTLVGCDSSGTNAFFIKSSLFNHKFNKNIQELYRPPKYGKIVNGKNIGHPGSKKSMINF